MSMHTDHHHDYFASRVDGSFCPAVVMLGGIFAVAAVAWTMAW